MMDERERAQREESDPQATAEEAIQAQLEAAEGADDPERLKVLEELYSALESELEGDLDQEGSPRH